MSLLRQIDFGNEAADDTDADELAAYFVEQEILSNFLSPKYRFLTATARKGVGKSALLKWTAQKIQETNEEAIVIQCRGADLARSKFKLNTPLLTPNEHIYDSSGKLRRIFGK